jgi:hypothetical protein
LEHFWFHFGAPKLPRSTFFSATFSDRLLAWLLEGPWTPFGLIFGAIFEPKAHFLVPWFAVFSLFPPPPIPVSPTHQIYPPGLPTKVDPRPPLSTLPNPQAQAPIV